MKQVGNGIQTAFWTDCWKGSSSFESRFPRLFALENEKEVSVAERIKHGNNWNWRRPIRDGCEIEEFKHLKETLKECSLSDRPDGWK